LHTLSRFSSILLLVGSLLTATATRAEDNVTKGRDRARTSGLAAAIGFGTQTVLLGGQLLYYLQLPSESWRLAVHAGVGGMPSGGRAGAEWGVNGGLFLAFGAHHHRLIMGVEAGTLTWYTFSLHGAAVGRRQAYGAGATLGWEWMSSFGLFSRFSLGPAFMVEPQSPLEDRDVRLWAVGGGQVGYKLW
jgi:hypothetical protein